MDGSRTQEWLANDIRAGDISFSVISVAAARKTISDLKGPRRTMLQKALEIRLAALKNDGAIEIPFGEGEAKEWEQWMQHEPLTIERDGQSYSVGQDTRMVIATSIENGCTIVEPGELYHDELRALQFEVVSL
ncbi:hypothetical protein [Ralstonia pseudosolanacearum]|uniref:hypothetical protein n=1 Tax=Ralstonia pseudosolanacearum TaxID=1310165 RepID=UPI003CEDB76A